MKFAELMQKAIKELKENDGLFCAMVLPCEKGGFCGENNLS